MLENPTYVAHLRLEDSSVKLSGHVLQNLNYFILQKKNIETAR